jgi:uncharacterized delta-60 repeat protein
MQNMFLQILLFALLVINISYTQVTEQWVQRFTSDSTRNESVSDMFVDAEGNVYVTGSQRQTSLNFDIQAVTVKYNSQGEQQWIQNYVAENNNGAFARAIYVDAAGNVYVTGETAIYSGGGNDMLVIKYSPDGTQLWSYVFEYSSAYNGGYDIVTDLTGNVYVAGEYATNVITYNNISLVKFSPEGALLNQTFYHSNSEGGRKIGIDGAGKIIVGGYVNDNDSLSFIVLKYEQNLDFVWASRFGQGVGNQNTIDMVIDNNSNIIITGTNSVTIDYSTVKFNPAGLVMWSKQYNSPTGWDIARAIVKDNSGNIYISGSTGTSGFPLAYKITTIKYSPEGDELWVNPYDGTGIGADGYTGYNLAIDDEASVYAIGQVYSNSNIVTIKYNTSGSFEWAKMFNGGTNNSSDIPVAVGVDPNGNVFTAGNTNNNNFTTGNDIVIIKYVQTPTSVEDEGSSVSSFILEQNYPNPFNPMTKISWQSPFSSYQSLKVYDVLGNEVVTLVNEFKQAGRYEVEFDAGTLSSGVYLYKLTAGKFSETKKMLMLK